MLNLHFRRVKRLILTTGILMGLLFSNGCSGSKSAAVGIKDGRLSGCPDSPNCVSSEASDEGHQIAPFTLAGDPAANWPGVAEAVEAMPRTEIISRTDHYIYAECTSLIFRFVDDLELLLNPETGSVSVRSASRLGKSDFGVNRKRVESLRSTLLEKGLIQD